MNNDATGTTTVETTIEVPPADLGPPLEEIPESPDVVVELEPGPESPTAAHLEYLHLLAGYAQGSARVEGIYPAPDGPLHLITWHQIIESLERRCRAVVPDNTPIEDRRCGGADSPDPRNSISGMSYGSDPGDNTIEIEHTPGALATVIELSDGEVHLIRPGDSALSYHEWNGAPPIRVTVFWPEGITASKVLTH